MADDETATAGMTPTQRRLFELRLKVNAGRKANKKEVAAEHERLSGGDGKGKKKQAQGASAEDKPRKAGEKRTHLDDTAEAAAVKAKKDEKKAKRKAAFGWDVFNQDSLYKAYKKRLTSLPTTSATAAAATATPAATDNPSASSRLEDELSYGKNDKVAKADLDRMAQELEGRIKARKDFSRRRQHHEGEDVDYINDQNRIFNRKASHAFDKYTVEIRQNLERGTAL